MEYFDVSRKYVKELIGTFYIKRYYGASTYLKNAAEKLFTVIKKCLTLGYMFSEVSHLFE